MARFRNGVFVGFAWTHDGGGISSRHEALLFSYHPPTSITWTKALYWSRPTKRWCPSASRWVASGRRLGGLSVYLPVLGGLNWRWQKPMEKQNHD